MQILLGSAQIPISGETGFDVSSSFIVNSTDNSLLNKPYHMTSSIYFDELIHSHDNGSLRASTADVNFAERVSDKYITAKFFTYSFTTNSYLKYSRYSEKGNYTIGDITVTAKRKKKK